MVIYKINMIKESTRDLSAGIFWYDNIEDKLIVVNYYCDLEGNVDLTNDFNSKSKLTYNHEKTWSVIKLDNRSYRRYSYRYFPRGRVMIKNGKVIVYYNKNLDTEDIRELIVKEFGLSSVRDKIKWNIDNSNHYQCHLDDNTII